MYYYQRLHDVGLGWTHHYSPHTFASRWKVLHDSVVVDDGVFSSIIHGVCLFSASRCCEGRCACRLMKRNPV